MPEDESAGSIFGRLSEPGRREIFFARYEASACGEGAVGPEHFLLGICREDPAELVRFGFPTRSDVTRLADAIRAALPTRPLASSARMPLAQSAKRILAAAANSAGTAVHPSDLLDAISRQKDTPAARFLLRE